MEFKPLVCPLVSKGPSPIDATSPQRHLPAAQGQGHSRAGTPEQNQPRSEDQGTTTARQVTENTGVPQTQI